MEIIKLSFLSLLSSAQILRDDILKYVPFIHGCI